MGAPRSLNRKSDADDRRAKLSRWAEDHDTELIFLDPPETFDHAIVGLVYGYGQEVAVLYDEGLIIASLMTDGGMDAETAKEYFEYNTIGAYLGDATPRFLLPTVDDAS
jgi:hypothetical protein